MNKKYVIRQIKLWKLGIPMNKEVKDYYDYFHQLIGNIKEYEDPIIKRKFPDSIFWTKENDNDIKPLLEYIKKEKQFLVSNNKIWKKFAIEYDMDYRTIHKLLLGLLEEHFKVHVESTHCAWQ